MRGGHDNDEGKDIINEGVEGLQSVSTELNVHHTQPHTRPFVGEMLNERPGYQASIIQARANFQQ